MKHDEASDLLEVHAVGTVHGDEGVALRAHIETCERCRTQLRELAPVSDLLGARDRLVPEDLRAELIAAIRSAQHEHARFRSASGRRRRQLAVATAAVVLVSAVATVGIRQQRRIDELAVALRNPAANLVDAAAASGSDSFELRSPDGRAAAAAVITQSGIGYLDASSLPNLASERTYQLWGIEGDRVVSLGLLGADPGVVQFVGQVFTTFALTDEIAGGVSQPSQAPIAQGARP